MTQHDQISAYIDNELTGEQEQDFLISLASSDALRKSFRSELVLKNVIHRDEVLTTPSRNMRGAVLATLGVSTVAIASETADAATSVAPAAKASILKTMFASKMSALITASMVTASALGGYGIHSVITERSSQQVQPASIHSIMPRTEAAPQNTTSPVTEEPSHGSAPATKKTTVHHIAPKQTEPVQKEPINTISGENTAGSKPPVMDKQ
jgi:negative regulator of sigma E activity